MSMTYIGSRIAEAEAMTLEEFCGLREAAVRENHKHAANELGYLVKTYDRGGVVEAPTLPYLTMFNAQGEWVVGWLASQSDMLAEDWSIVK